MNRTEVLKIQVKYGTLLAAKSLNVSIVSVRPSFQASLGALLSNHIKKYHHQID